MVDSTLVAPWLRFFALLVGLLGAAEAWAGEPPATAPHQEPAGQFVANRGQWPAPVLYAADVPLGRLFLGPQRLTHALLDVRRVNELQHRHAPDSSRVRAHSYTVTFEGANSQAQVLPADQLPTERNYFLSNDPRRWASQVPAYAQLRYQQLYPGTDLRVYSQGVALEYDFELAVGADPKLIRLRYEGADQLRIDAAGALHIATSVGEVVEQRPYAYQEINGQRRAVPCRFRLRGRVLSFELPAGYDRQRPLIIDPVLLYSSYSGAVTDNYGYTATYDDAGNLYSGGVVFAPGFPATTGAYSVQFGGICDMAILKFDPTRSGPASLRYATYIGGQEGDHPHSMVVDHQNNLLIMGSSSDNTFPTTAGAYSTQYGGGDADLVVCKLSSTGSQLLASTFVGGQGEDGQLLDLNLNQNQGDTFRGEVQVDAAGSVYVASVTNSANFPVVGGFQQARRGGSDAVVLKLAPGLNTLLWSTLLGGQGADAAYSVQIDAAGNVVVSGGTTSPDLPGTAGSAEPSFHGGQSDGFLALISPGGNVLRRSAYLGTPRYDQAYFVQLDQMGNVYALGQSEGEYPVTAGRYFNPGSRLFIHKFSPDLTVSQLSTRVGPPSAGNVNLSPTAFLVDDCNRLMFSAWGGNSQGAAVTPDALFQTSQGGFYLMQLTPDAGQLTYGTYFSAGHVDGGTSRFDKRGIVYQSMCTSGGLLTTTNAYSAVCRAGFNNAAFKLELRQRAGFVQSATPNGPRVQSGCAPFTVYFQPSGLAASTPRSWDLGDGTVTTQPGTITHVYTRPGRYPVRLTVTDPNVCPLNQVVTDSIIVYARPLAAAGPDHSICPGSSVALNAAVGEPGTTHQWTPGRGLSSTSGPSVTAAPTVTTTYYLTVTNTGGCVARDTVVVNVRPALLAGFTPLSATGLPQRTGCAPLTLTFRPDPAIPGSSAHWSFGDGTTSAATGAVGHVYALPGRYPVQLTVSNPGACPTTKTVIDTITVYALPRATAGPDQRICAGQQAALTAATVVEPGITYQWTPAVGLSSTSGPSVTAAPTVTTTYYLTVTNPGGCVARDTVVVLVTPQAQAAFTAGSGFAVTQEPVTFTNTSTNATTYAWSFGDGHSSPAASPTHAFAQPGTYEVVLLASNGAGQCLSESRLSLEVRRFELPNVITPNHDGLNDTFKPLVSSAPVDVEIFNRWGRKVFSQAAYAGTWGPDAPPGTYYFLLRGRHGETWKGWLEVVR